MIELTILRALLLDDEDLALEATKNYGIVKCLNLISKSKLRNNFLRLLRNLNESIEQEIKDAENKSLKLVHDAKNLSNNLNDYGINHIFFKGIPLSSLFYTFPADRTLNDFDILIDTNDIKKFYKYLDNNLLKHHGNYKYLNRFGYTRTALEVVKSSDGNVYDFHYRIISRMFSNQCPITHLALESKYDIEGLSIPSKNILLITSLYHCFKQNNNYFNPQIFLDLHHITKSNFNEQEAKEQLKKLNLDSYFEKFLLYKELIKSGSQSDKVIKFSKDLFVQEKQSKGFFSNPIFLKTQLAHFFDPEPYINYAGGNIKKNKFTELIKTKIKRRKIRNL
tara:strand:+ start:192 stop:1199 length:1008 start_codon:yes stop_codon:yes gene_type:complete